MENYKKWKITKNGKLQKMENYKKWKITKNEK